MELRQWHDLNADDLEWMLTPAKLAVYVLIHPQITRIGTWETVSFCCNPLQFEHHDAWCSLHPKTRKSEMVPSAVHRHGFVFFTMGYSCHLEVSWNRGTPSYHPFLWDFPTVNHPFWVCPISILFEWGMTHPPPSPADYAPAGGMASVGSPKDMSTAMPTVRFHTENLGRLLWNI